jgi:hypothetical protein
MEVLQQALRAPGIYLAVEWRHGALLEPPPHIVAICEFCAVEMIVLLQPLETP